jgi:hypothetical protein
MRSCRLTISLILIAMTSCTGKSSQTGTAPSGTVISVNTSSLSFVLKDSSGNSITIDTVSGSTYPFTVKLSSPTINASTISYDIASDASYSTTVTSYTAVIGDWVAALGSVSDGQLDAVDLAYVPTPPDYIAQYDNETTSYGTTFFGQITAISSSGVISINAGGTTLYINTTAATAITLTTNSTFSDISIGETVEVNGPEVSSTEYTGHQINIGLTPAVVGQFD